MAEDLILGLDAFIRSIGINKASPHALLLGAGASISSGVPSAASCIWEWKRAVFLTRNPGLEAQFAELSLPAVRSKIQTWLDSQRIYPRNGSPEEYGFYIKECYPIAEDRRAFFQEKVRHAVPHVGYNLTVKLAECGLVQSVWTTNFDGLVGKAAAHSNAISAIEVGIDCQERLFRRPNRNELISVSLHGDYRYDSLKNTAAELQQQENTLRESLVEQLKNVPLLVVGYSGRDASLVAARKEAYSRAGTGGLYWCGFGDADVPAEVGDLLQLARSHRRSAYYVQSGGFNDLMLRIALHCLDGDGVKEARQLMAKVAPTPTEERVEFRLADLPVCGIIKSNAFPLVPPSEIYEFDLKQWPEKNSVWEYFDGCTAGKAIVAAPFRGKAYAFGTIDDIRNAFLERIGDKIERVPINEIDLRYEDGIISSLICWSLVRSMAERSGVNTDGRGFLWDRAAKERTMLSII